MLLQDIFQNQIILRKHNVKDGTEISKIDLNKIERDIHDDKIKGIKEKIDLIEEAKDKIETKGDQERFARMLDKNKTITPIRRRESSKKDDFIYKALKKQGEEGVVLISSEGLGRIKSGTVPGSRLQSKKNSSFQANDFRK